MTHATRTAGYGSATRHAPCHAQESSSDCSGLIAEHGISWLLPRVVGTSSALDLLLSSRVVSGKEAKELGLATRVFDSSPELLRETLSYAREMARLCSPASLAEIKAQVYAHASTSPRAAFDESLRLMRQSFEHPDSKEGVFSYIERRDPAFQGLAAGRIRDLRVD